MRDCQESYFVVKYFIMSETPEWLKFNSHRLYVNPPEIGRFENCHERQLFIMFGSHDKNTS